MKIDISVEKHWLEETYCPYFKCPFCDKGIPYEDYAPVNYCGYCGKKIEWVGKLKEPYTD